MSWKDNETSSICNAFFFWCTTFAIRSQTYLISTVFLFYRVGAGVLSWVLAGSRGLAGSHVASQATSGSLSWVLAGSRGFSRFHFGTIEGFCNCSNPDIKFCILLCSDVTTFIYVMLLFRLFSSFIDWLNHCVFFCDSLKFFWICELFCICVLNVVDFHVGAVFV